MSPDSSRLYVGNYLDSTVTVINTATNAVVTTIAVAAPPTFLTMNSAGTLLY
ncbi:MAG: YncE family protein, partial [Ilumatobacteraceae bacterium]